EQAEGRGATAASDLYALGLVLYEALAGVNPVRQGNAAATARRVGTRLPALRRLRRDLPRALCAALDACVQPDPAMRRSVASLRSALTAALHDVADEPGAIDGPWVGWATEGFPRSTPSRPDRWAGEPTVDEAGPRPPSP